MNVTLEVVTAATVDAYLALDVGPDQRKLVGSVAKTIAQAHFSPGETWFRGIALDGEPAGFVALYLEPGSPPYLWRLLVDTRFQRRGVGRAALAEVVREARRLVPGATELRLSHVPAEGDPGPFYVGLGFRYTGEVHDGERVMTLPLPGEPAATGGPPGPSPATGG